MAPRRALFGEQVPQRSPKAFSLEELDSMRRFVTGLSAVAVSMGVVLVPHAFAQPKPSITVLSPNAGDTIISTDIPVSVQVSNFSLSPADVALPDKDAEAH